MQATKAVFLSYSSEDAEAANTLAESLCAAGVEVWFDQSELRGGDAWDATIRKQIKACELFIPLISHNSDAREEGYFRLEWKLAVDRSHLMAAEKTFLLPVVVDGIADAEARVPDRFREVQWTRLANGIATPAFVQRIKRLLARDAAPVSQVHEPADAIREPHRDGVAPAVSASAGAARPPKFALLILGSLLALAIAYIVIGKLGGQKMSIPEPPRLPSTEITTFAPPPHSVAVLPFVNMSGDPSQDYFSDGLSEELLNSLVTVRDLQVAARTSSFAFKGKNEDVAEIAHKLNVGAVLEGSVRKDGKQIRVTAQLINATTGYHIWSHTYDRELKSVLALQTEIATAVTQALQVTLLTDPAGNIEIGGTQNPAAFDAYLRARGLELKGPERENLLRVKAGYAQAVELDPKFAKAYAGLAVVQQVYANNYASGHEFMPMIVEARATAQHAIELAPDLGEAHAAMASVLTGTLQFRGALAESEKALALSPNSPPVLRRAARLFSSIGRIDAAIAYAQKAIAYDPINAAAFTTLSTVYWNGHRYQEALQAQEQAIDLAPGDASFQATVGLIRMQLGELDGALAACEPAQRSWQRQLCLSILYDKLHRHSEAEQVLATMKATMGDAASYQYAEIYAQWGDIPAALDALEKAYTLPDPGISSLRTDVLLDPLRGQARMQVVLKKVDFPD